MWYECTFLLWKYEESGIIEFKKAKLLSGLRVVF
jgi:hypothetical protein